LALVINIIATFAVNYGVRLFVMCAIIIHFVNLGSAARPQLKDLHNFVTPKYAAKWKAIGKSLGLSEALLDTTDHGNGYKAEDCCNAVWEQWLDMDNNASWNKVFSAIDLLLSNPSANAAPCTNSEKFLLEVSSILQGVYIEKRFEINDDNWPPHQLTVYTTVVLIHHTEETITERAVIFIADQVHKTEIISSTSSAEGIAVTGAVQERPYFTSYKYNNNVFKIFPPHSGSKSPPYVILIEGEPGIGKTVLSKEIAFLWANGTVLKHKKVLILMFLCDPRVQKLTSIVELAQYVTCVSQDSKVAEVFSSYLINTSGKNILFVFDGYDELPEALRHKSLIADIINRKVLPCCDIVITSRPTASAHLHKVVERRIEILGFTSEGRRKYIDQACQSNSSKIDKIMEYLQSNPFIDSLCYLPFNMTIIMCLFMESSQSHLPTTQTEMINQFMCMTISRYCRRKENTILSFNSLFEIPKNYKKLLKEFSWLAFDLLGKDKVIFSNADVPQLPYKNVHDMGLLKAVNFVNFTDNCEYSFLYFSLQEFLAAFYITSLSTAEQEKIIRRNFWNSRYLNTWIMYCGLTGGKSIAMKHFLSGNRFLLFGKFFGAKGILHGTVDDKVKCLHLFRCFLEAGNITMCEQVGQLLHHKKIDLSGQVLLPKDIHTLCFFLTKSSNKQWEVINLSKCYVEDQGFNILITSYLDQLNFSLNILDISSNLITPSSLHDVCKLVLHLKVKKLVVLNNNLANEIVSKQLLSCTINSSDCIPSLTVVNNSGKIDLCLSSHKSYEESLYTINTEFEVLKELNDAQALSQIQLLHIWNCKVKPNDVKMLIESNLRLRVNMFNTNLYDSEVDEWQKIFHPRIISQYHLDMNFRGNVCYTLKSDNALLIFREYHYFNEFILQTAYKFLSVFQITNCTLTCEMLSNVGIIISGSEQCWKVVGLSHCRIDDDGFHVLCSHISRTPVEIKSLNLSNNILTRDCIRDIISLLRTCIINECILSHNSISEDLLRDALLSDVDTQCHTSCNFIHK